MSDARTPRGASQRPPRLAPARSASSSRALRPRAGAQGVRELLAFRLGTAVYALPLASVREIARLGPLTEVPRAPADVLGVVSVRGRVTTVIDLRRRLRLEATPPTRHTRLLFVDAGAEVFGLLVEAVLQVHRLRDEEFEPGAGRPGEPGDAVAGLGRPAAARPPTRPPGGSETAASERPAPGDGHLPLLIVLDPRALWRG